MPKAPASSHVQDARCVLSHLCLCASRSHLASWPQPGLRSSPQALLCRAARQCTAAIPSPKDVSMQPMLSLIQQYMLVLTQQTHKRPCLKLLRLAGCLSDRQGSSEHQLCGHRRVPRPERLPSIPGRDAGRPPGIHQPDHGFCICAACPWHHETGADHAHGRSMLRGRAEGDTPPGIGSQLQVLLGLAGPWCRGMLKGWTACRLANDGMPKSAQASTSFQAQL